MVVWHRWLAHGPVRLSSRSAARARKHEQQRAQGRKYHSQTKQQTRLDLRDLRLRSFIFPSHSEGAPHRLSTTA